MPELEHAIAVALDAIKDPCSLAAGNPMGLHEMGLVRKVDISCDGAVRISLRLTSPFCHMIGFFKSEAVERVLALEGVRSVEIDADNGLDWSPSLISPSATSRRREHVRDLEHLPQP